MPRLRARPNAERSKVALLVLDLDKFKQINDTLGHACGDQLLCASPQRLTPGRRDDGLVARLSGDEFAIVISGADVADRAEKLAERISLAFRKIAFVIGERQLRVNVSIGVAIYPDYCSDLRTSCSATPTSRSTGPRPPAAAARVLRARHPRRARSRRCRSRPSCSARREAASSSCSTSRRSASRTASWSAPRR